jgi:hypothetical protein
MHTRSLLILTIISGLLVSIDISLIVRILVFILVLFVFVDLVGFFDYCICSTLFFPFPLLFARGHCRP